MGIENWPVTTWVGIGGGVILVWLVGLSVMVIRAINHYRRLIQGATKKDLRAILELLLTKVENLEAVTGKLGADQERANKETGGHLQKVGLVRFNPFTDTGGDQSFCLTLLDRHKSGVMISSLHSRDQTRVYAKRVSQGKAEGVEFSKEEKRAIEDAQQR